jgi:hypothetical protein
LSYPYIIHVVLISLFHTQRFQKYRKEIVNYEGLFHSVTRMKGKEHCLQFVGGSTVGYKNLNIPLITEVKTHKHCFPRVA